MAQQHDAHSEARSLLESRGVVYGEAWKKTGWLLAWLKPGTSEIGKSPYLFCWVMILNKLMRALTSPENKDHWLDIIGYATLVSGDLE